MAEAESGQQSATLPHGTLRVVVQRKTEGHEDPPVPVTIRRLSTALVARGLSNEALLVEPGHYLIQATLPGGVDLFEEATVIAGEESAVQLSLPVAPDVPAPRSSPRHAIQQFYARPLALTASTETGQESSGSYVDDRTQRSVYVRLETGNPLQGPLTAFAGMRVHFSGHGSDDSAVDLPEKGAESLNNLPALHELRPDSGTETETWLAPTTYQLAFQLPPSDQKFTRYWLRITTPPDVTRYASVPGLSGDTLFLVIARRGQKRAFSVTLHLPLPAIDVLLYQRGLLNEAMKESFLKQSQVAQESPVYTVVRNLFALRTGQALSPITAPNDALLNLPDYWVIDAESKAREGNHPAAVASFVRAVQELPLFSESLGYITTRVPQYLRMANAESRQALGPISDLKEAWNRLLPGLEQCDLKSVTLFLRGQLDTKKSDPMTTIIAQIDEIGRGWAWLAEQRGDSVVESRAWASSTARTGGIEDTQEISWEQVGDQLRDLAVMLRETAPPALARLIRCIEAGKAFQRNDLRALFDGLHGAFRGDFLRTVATLLLLLETPIYAERRAQF